MHSDSPRSHADAYRMSRRRFAGRFAATGMAAAAAGLGAGVIRRADLGRFARYEPTVEPGPQAGRAAQAYAEWRETLGTI